MQVIGMGGIRARPYAGGESAASGLPHGQEESVLDGVLGPFNTDLQAACLPGQGKGEDIERPTCRMLAQRPGRSPVATPAFLAASNPQTNQIATEIAFRQRLNADQEKLSRLCRHLAAQGDRRLEDDRNGPHLKRLDQDGALDAAGGILGFGGISTGRANARAIKRPQPRQAGSATPGVRQVRWAQAGGGCSGVGGLRRGRRRLLRAQINRARWRQGPDPCPVRAVALRRMNFCGTNTAYPDRDGRNGQGEPAKASQP